MVNVLEKMCPTVLQNPATFNKLMKHVHSHSTLTQRMPIGLFIEERPELVSKLAIINYGAHYP